MGLLSDVTACVPPIAALFLLLALTGCTGEAAQGPQDNNKPEIPAIAEPGKAGKLVSLSNPGKVTYTITVTTCHTSDEGQLPDPAFSPGGIDPTVTQANLKETICRAGAAASRSRT